MDKIEVMITAKIETHNIVNLRAPVKISYWQKFKLTSLEARNCFRQEGFRGVVRKYGWRVLAVFFAYYMIRDMTLYIAVPWLVGRHFIR